MPVFQRQFYQQCFWMGLVVTWYIQSTSLPKTVVHAPERSTLSSNKVFEMHMCVLLSMLLAPMKRS